MNSHRITKILKSISLLSGATNTCEIVQMPEIIATLPSARPSLDSDESKKQLV